ncbi:MAG: sigma-70 family RNA polymerase sigma factor [Ruminococcus flavefaciens]|nr:sigma-70 family RNA polymerase sigma factor [Ruminococcus flavefaciens]
MNILLDLDFNLNEFSGKTDEELALIAKSDKKAVSTLVFRYLKLIFFKAGIYTVPETDSDDLRQEGLMGLLRAIASFDMNRGVKFSTFAEVCIVNQMKTFLAKSRKNPVSCESLDDISADSISEEKTPESIYIDKEFFSELWHAVDSILSETERKIFTLVIEGRSYGETARILGISDKAVDNAMQRARRKIRAHFRKY